MVQWTDCERKAITSLWGKINVAEIGAQSLIRLLVVYPWTRRHFASFGNLSTTAAIMGNDKVAEHGKRVMNGLQDAIKDMDNIKKAYAKLSAQHSDDLHVDPDNFRLLAECITVCMAAKFGIRDFTPDVQEAWQKFLAVVVSALSKQYH